MADDWLALFPVVVGTLIRIPVHGLAKVGQRWTRGGERTLPGQDDIDVKDARVGLV